MTQEIDTQEFEVLSQIRSVFEKFLVHDSYEHYLKVNHVIKDKSNSIELSFGSEYQRPQINLAGLIELADIFGTKEIDLDNYGISGCETCDSGSDYGHTIQIYNMSDVTFELLLKYLNHDLMD